MTRPTLCVIPTYLRREADLELVARCLVTLRETAPTAEVLVVDDGSPVPELVEAVEAACGELGVWFDHRPTNEGFSRTVNVGLRIAHENACDAVLVNADIEFTQPGWLDVMRARTDSQGRPAAVVGARLLYPNGLLQHAGVMFSLLGRDWYHRFHLGPSDLPEALVACRCPVTAALQLIRLETLASIGIYDESFGLAHEDMDYCLRVFEAGLECIYEPAVVAFHHESLFRGKRSKKIEDMHKRSIVRLLEKHGATDMSPWTPEVL